MGSALLKRWVRQPLLDVAAIQRRHGLVEIFHGEPALREQLKQDCLRGVPDVHRIVQRLKRGRATLKELWDLRSLAQRLPKIVTALRGYEGVKREDLQTNFLGRLEGLLKEFALYESFTSQAIDLTAAGSGMLRINPGLSPELQQLKRQMDSVEEEIDTYLTCDLPRQLPAKVPAKVLRTDKPGKHDDGWSLRVNKGFEKHIPGVPGYVEIKTVKAGIVFTTKKLRGLNDTLSELNDERLRRAL